MATFTPQREETDIPYEPSPIFHHHAVAIGHQVFQYGGRTLPFSQAIMTRQVSIFDQYTEQWRSTKTAGLSPPGMNNGCTIFLNGDIFHYGGRDRTLCHGGLYCLKLVNLQWECVDSCIGDGAPMKKDGCRMVIVGDNKIGLLGGSGIPRSSLQPGSTFTHMPKSDYHNHGKAGFTNEFHVFDFIPGTWSSPTLTGERPPPSTGFSLVKMTKKKAVYFGGNQGFGRNLRGYVNDLFVIDFEIMECTKIEPEEGEPWPAARYGHAACCLSYGDESPQMLITCGLGSFNEVLNDAWMLDFTSMKWKELTLPDGMVSRFDHTTTAVNVGPGVIEVTMFGGITHWPKDLIWKSDDDFTDLTNNVTIMRFVSIECSSFDGRSSTREWVLEDVTISSDNQGDMDKRLREKMMKIASKAKEIEGDSVQPLVNVDSEATFTSLCQLEETTDIPVTTSTYIVPWMAKRHHSHPTWRQLVQYLRDINLVQLAEQIEQYIHCSQGIDQLHDIILTAVLNGLTAPIKRAVQVMKQYPVFSESFKTQVLDFLPHKEFTNVPSTQMSHSPLMIACGCENKEMVGTLLQLGASKDYKNKEEVTPLHIACSTGNLEIVKQILHGQLTDYLLATDKNGHSVLHYASTCLKDTVPKFLEWLLDDKKLKHMLNHVTYEGYTPLTIACEHHNEGVVKYLLDQPEVKQSLHVDRNVKGNVYEIGVKNGLHIAAIHDSPAIAEILINKGYPIDLQDAEGNTALHIAFKKSSTDVIDILRRAEGGRLTKIRNKDGQLPAEVQRENIIPPEIVKRGDEAVRLYKKALAEGKRKIPRLSLLFLGDKCVGKTSLYRLLVLLGFNADQDSTRGIDNTEIKAVVDTRHVDIEKWEEKKESDCKKESDEMFVRGVIGALPENLIEQNIESNVEQISAGSLLAKVQEIEKTVAKYKQKQFSDSGAYSQKDLLSQDREIHNQTIRHPERNDSTQSLFTSLSDTPQENSIIELSTYMEAKTDLPSNATITSGSTHQIYPKPVKQDDTTALAVGSRHVTMISEHLRSNKLARDETTIVLNALDFAGQEVYRPLHHNFIRRRAAFLLVFNLLKMREFLLHRGKENPLEQVRYWLHSINAHIYPPIKGENDTEVKRVLMVGTHKASPGEMPLSEDELDKIHQLFVKEIYSDKRCANHVHFMGASNRGRIFAAVENSIDGKDTKDRNESGAKALQEELKEISQELPFLQEDYPILWLRFESELVRLRDSLKQNNLSQVVQLEEIKKVASSCGIASPDSQELALRFLHDTGKIIFLKYLSTLFLSESEKIELANLVVLDPCWVITIANSVVELGYNDRIRGELICDLKLYGIASAELLQKCWTNNNLIQPPIQCHQLCLILQAFCIIHPITDESLAQSSIMRQHSTSSSDHSSTIKTMQKFLVPCKLPELTQACLPFPWVTFFFDFLQYLPEEIYHRLICLFLAAYQRNQEQVRRQKGKLSLTSSWCEFSLDECQWRIEFERNEHRLKISVLSDDDDKTRYIDIIHTKYLLRICQESNLQGLEYHGGPMVECERCGETGVLRCVEYSNGKSLSSCTPKCVSCYKSFTVSCVNKFLTPQDEVSEFLKWLKKIKLGDKDCDALRDNGITTAEVFQMLTSSDVLQLGLTFGGRKILESYLKPSHNVGETSLDKRFTPMKPSTQAFSGAQPLEKPDLKDLLKELLPNTSDKWEDIGLLLGIKSGVLDIVRANQQDVRSCLREMLKIWLKRVEPPPSWPAISEAIEVVGDEQLASYLRHKYC